MYRLFKAGWYISIVMFLGTLLYIYAGMTEKMTFSGTIGVLGYFTKNEFFYLTFGVFLIVNIFSYVLVRLLEIRMKNSKLIHTWVGGLFGFSCVVNFFFITSLFALSFFQNGILDFFYLAYVGPALIVIWMITFPVMLLRERSKIGRD